jgi:hypothetical protein
VKIRAYDDRDLKQVQQIHRAQNLGYDFPPINDPTFFIRIVGEHEGKIVQAAFAHITAEIYFMLDPETGTPQERHLWFLSMQEVGRELASNPGGLDDLHAFLPPQMEKSFARRLMVHGWKKALWPAYFCELGD